MKISFLGSCKETTGEEEYLVGWETTLGSLHLGNIGGGNGGGWQVETQKEIHISSVTCLSSILKTDKAMITKIYVFEI